MEPRILSKQQEKKMSTKRKAESHSRAENRPCIMKSGGSPADSERDSGFSGLILPLLQFHVLLIIKIDLMSSSYSSPWSIDASSEHLSTIDATDNKDSPRPARAPQTQGSGSGPQPSQLAVVGGSYSNLSPMIIMNNVLLKQVHNYYTQKQHRHKTLSVS